MSARTPQFARALECSARDLLLAQQAPAKAPRDAESDAAAVRAALAGPARRNMAVNSGLYSAIFRSRRAEAKAFRRWVTGTVLPALRRTGRFDLGTPARALAMEAPPLREAIAAVRLARALFGIGTARAVWAEFGLPMPKAALPAPDDGLGAAIATWVEGRNHFTNDERAAGLGLGAPDQPTRARFGTVLRAMGWQLKKRRRGAQLHGCWHAPTFVEGGAAA